MNDNDDIIEAGDHPEDYDSAMGLGLSKRANTENYDGQSVGLEGGPGGEYQGHAEPERSGDEEEIRGLMPEDEKETKDDGIDVIR